MSTTITILVVNHTIQFEDNGTASNGNVHTNPSGIIQFESDTPFAIFFKAAARWPSRRPSRQYRLALLVNPPSPDDSNDAVLCSKFKQGMHRLKLKMKSTLLPGAIYWYGVAAFDPPLDIATIDPQIIIN